MLLAGRICAKNENALEPVAERGAGKHHAITEAGVLAPEKNKLTIQSVRLISSSDSTH